MTLHKAKAGHGKDQGDPLGDIKLHVYNHMGIKVSEDKLPSLLAKLQKLIDREGYRDLAELRDRLMSADATAMEHLSRYITIGHTFFFRESEHFDHLAAFLSQRRLAAPLIWDVACSTGEEAYSICMTLLEGGQSNFKLICSDINPGALERFNKGVYHLNRFEACPKAYRLKYFTKLDEEHFQVSDRLRRLLALKRINVMDPLDFPARFDAIFCRNVLIYFDPVSREVAIKNLLKNLKSGGCLYIGHAETILDTRFKLKKLGPSVFQKTEGDD